MIATRLTKLFSLRHPIILGPMGGASGGLLAAAVSNAGGLGMVGGGYGDPVWIERELALVKAKTKAPWGAGLITWSAGREVLDLVLAHRPAAVMLSFGDPRPYGPLIKAAGCKLICQVQDLEGARLAREAGADLIVAQGTEAGGHGGTRATLPLVPAVIDAVAPTPVVAAGGIADGRGLAAALMLGAEGALIGTRFYASTEALGHPNIKQRIVEAQGSDTVRTHVFDVVRGYHWPTDHTGRSTRNDFTARWAGHEKELQTKLESERTRYLAAAEAGDCDTAVVWAGEVVDLIQSVDGAGALVERISAEAEVQLKRADTLLR